MGVREEISGISCRQRLSVRSATQRNKYLQYEEAGEVEIRGSLELFEEVEGEKGEEGVLGGLDKIVLQHAVQKRGHKTLVATYCIVESVVVLLVIGDDIALGL